MFVRLSLFSLLVNSFLYSMKNDEPIIVPCSIHFTRSIHNYFHKNFNNDPITPRFEDLENSLNTYSEKTTNLPEEKLFIETVKDLKSLCYNEQQECLKIIEDIENSVTKNCTIQVQSQELREKVQKALSKNNLKNAEEYLNQLQLLDFPHNQTGFSAHKKAISKFKKTIQQKRQKNK